MVILVIDDESTARSLIKNIIERDESVHEVHEASNLKDGIAKIKEVNPKLVFLDIEMPQEAGTEIFNHISRDDVSFELVFCTAYSEYAVNAFELNAIDYILKPIRPSRVLDVIKKVESAFNQQDIQMRLHELRETLKNQQFRKIGVPVQDGIEFIPLDDIIHLVADGMYTKIVRRSGASLMVSKPLKFFNRLTEMGMPFYRPHRSHIFNLHFMKQFVKRDGNYIRLENDEMIPLSKEKREEFLLLIADL